MGFLIEEREVNPEQHGDDDSRTGHERPLHLVRHRIPPYIGTHTIPDLGYSSFRLNLTTR